MNLILNSQLFTVCLYENTEIDTVDSLRKSSTLKYEERSYTGGAKR